MKKLLLIPCIIFILTSCDLQDFWNYTVNNESSRAVTYSFNGFTDSLEANSAEVKSYQVKRGKRHTTIQNADAGSPHGFGVGVKLKSNGTNYTFYNVEPYTLIANNKSPITVTLNAENFINNEGAADIIIEPNSQVTSFIYTNKPNFSISEDYIVIIDWEFKDETVFVIIR